MISEVKNIDCMIGMKEFPDKYFELAIVDPPYGLGNFSQSDRVQKFGDYKWNESIPDENYFSELVRVAERQIVWGANYYNCFSNGGAIIWDKENPHPSMSRCEIASKSWERKVDYVKIRHYGFVGEEKSFHPCAKPVKLYTWLLNNYAKAGDKILDTHLGSGSSRIAAYKLGFDFWGYELDKDYFNAQELRFKAAIAEPLFDQPKVIQKTMFI